MVGDRLVGQVVVGWLPSSCSGGGGCSFGGAGCSRLVAGCRLRAVVVVGACCCCWVAERVGSRCLWSSVG